VGDRLCVGNLDGPERFVRSLPRGLIGLRITAATRWTDYGCGRWTTYVDIRQVQIVRWRLRSARAKVVP